jgi:hypothetical protein
MGKGHTHLKEALIAPHLEKYSAKLKLRDTDEVGNVTTTQRDTGRAFTDHKEWAVATSQINDEYIVLMQDFSALDQTSKFQNARRFWIEAFEIVFGEEGASSPVIDGKQAHQHLIDFWKRVHDSVFILPNGPKRKTDFYKLFPDMLLSGEFITRYFNDMTTFAFFKYCERMMTIENQHLQSVSVRIQGDDMIEVRATSGTFRSWNQNKRALFIQAYKEKRAELAKKCALEINPTKFLTSPIMFEFLKKMMVLGVFWPRYMQSAMGQNESERIDRTVPSIQRMIARVGQHREYIFRGGPFIETMFRCHLEWNLIRQVNITGSSRMVLPFSILYAPLSKGGVGILPWSILDPNVDTLLFALNWSLKTSSIIKGWGYASSNNRVNTVKDFAAAAATKMKKSIEWISSNSNKKALELSIEASKVLEDEYGYKDPVPYFSRAEPMIKQTFEDAPQMNRTRVEDKSANTRNALFWLFENLPNIMDESIEIEPHPLSELVYIPGEVMPDRTGINYIAGLDPVIDMWTRELGPSARSNAISIDIFKSMKKLLVESSIPSNLSENMADRLAKTIIENRFTDARSIFLLFLSRGAGDSIELAQTTADSIAANVEQMRFVADISNFSIVGEGFTDKSRERVSMAVEMSEPYSGQRSLQADIIRTIGFQWVRSCPLIRIDESGELVYNERRNVYVDIPTSVLIRDLISKYGMKPSIAFYNFRDPTLNLDDI